MKQLLSVILLAVLFTGFINAQGKIALGVQAGVAIPLGDFEKASKMGFGGQANFAYHISPMMDITASVGYLTWSQKDIDGGGVVTITGFKISSVPVMAGVRYYFGKGKFKPYVTAELGLHFETVETPSITIVGLGTVPSTSVTGSDFGFGGGAGFLYQLSPKLGIDVSAKYNSIGRTGSALNFVSIMAGVLVAL